MRMHPGYMPPMLNATNAAGRASKIEATPLRRLGITGTELVIDGGYIAQ